MIENLDQVAARAETASMKFERHTTEEEDEFGQTYEEPFILLEVPNGRNKRTVTVSADNAELFLASGFDSWVFLGDYAAVYERASGKIEALIEEFSSSQFRRPLASTIARIYKTRCRSEEAGCLSPELAAASPDQGVLRLINAGPVPSAGAEISPVTAPLAMVERGAARVVSSLSLKLKVDPEMRHDDALNLMTRLASAILFDLDLLYDCAARLALHLPRDVRIPQQGASWKRYEKVPYIPRNAYASEALSLYSYARSVREMPLMAYLAYYQSMEFFFPAHVHAATVKRVKQRLRDPGFDFGSDSDVAGLMRLAQAAGKGFTSEEEQLKILIRNCVDNATIADYVREDPEREKFLANGKQLAGVPPLVLSDKNFPVSDQAAKRIYSIRCRIVHAKEDGGPRNVELLLPNSPEARKLSVDTGLIRFLAQRILLANSSQVTW